VQLEDPQRLVDLEPTAAGYHVGVVEACPAGSRYRFVPDGATALADPASRLQPEGVFGPSEVVDLGAHRWGDGDYRQRPLAEQIVSECHVGTLTKAGTFDAALEVLDDLVEVGISAVELMPVAAFPGRRNWGYDGVFPFSVQASYGGPAGLQRLVDACHRRGLAVVLDVVHNHLGPLGCVLDAFGPYFSDRYRTPWGPALNFDGPLSDHVRAFFFESVAQWFVDYHLDALRLDAIHSIVDRTATPFLAELSDLAAHLSEQLGRPCSLIAETSDNDPGVVAPRCSGGLGMDAQWNDDFHHALFVVLTGEQRAYYADYGAVEDLARAINEGFVLQGEYSAWHRRRHGARADGVNPERLVVFAQNHDQIGNRPRGERLATLVPPDRQRLGAAMVLLGPGIPLLFMGEEYGDPAPFPFFVDHGDAALLEAVHRGRSELLSSMGFVEEPLDEGAEETFALAFVDRSLRDAPGHHELLALTRRLIALRRAEPALAGSGSSDVSASVHDTVLTVTRSHPSASVACLFNLGPGPAAAPAPAGDPGQRRWRRLLDSAELTATGEVPRLPDIVSTGEPITLGPFGFCVYRSGPAGPAEGERP
jgi:maltooligosyltrehalose trehalohydrolase